MPCFESRVGEVKLRPVVEGSDHGSASVVLVLTRKGFVPLGIKVLNELVEYGVVWDTPGRDGLRFRSAHKGGLLAAT